MINYILIFITVFGTVGGQIILKFGEQTLYFPKNISINELFLFITNTIFNIYFISSLILALIAALSWSLAIQKINLSVAYPFMSLSYILVFLASYFIFKESISLYQIIGLIFIIVGVSFISLK